jgi:hypothetical protein
MYFSSIIYDYLPTFGQVFDPTLEEIRRFACEEIVEPILEINVVVKETPRRLLERAEEVAIRWGKVRRVGPMWKNLPVEFLNGRFLHVCIVWSGVFVGLLPPDGEVVDNSVHQ